MNKDSLSKIEETHLQNEWNPNITISEEERSLLKRKNELISELDQMIKTMEELPQMALLAPITHYDLCSALMLIHAIFKH